MSIKLKLYGLCLTLLLALLLSCNAALMFMEDMNESTNVLSRHWLTSITIAEELNTLTSDFRIAETRHVLAQDSISMDRYAGILSATNYQIETLFREYYTNYITNQVDRDLINQAHNLWQEYQLIHKRKIHLSTLMDTIGAVRMIENESKPIFDETSNIFLQLVEFNKNGANESRKESDAIYKKTRTILNFVMISTVLFGAVASYIFLNKITEPVEEVREAAAKIVKGDLSVQIDYVSKDEIGQLADSMRNLCFMFQGIVADLSQLLRKLSDGDFTAKSQRPELYVGEFATLLGLVDNISERLTNFLSSNKKLQKISEQESLTKLYNAGYFHKYAENRVKDLEGGCLVLIDIDYFKQVNDTHGHQAGDTVIKDVAKVLEKYFRSNDTIARLGGDEFVILLEKEVAIEFLEARAKSILHDLASNDYAVPVSLSIGGYIFNKPMTYKELYLLADKALYKVKEKGRNGYLFEKKVS